MCGLVTMIDEALDWGDGLTLYELKANSINTLKKLGPGDGDIARQD